ncbi:GTP pyrophosphokinase [Ruminococcus sp. zg-924]|uniref:GTP pyrophosphokinase n=1 Tax=Ruminococcus sp. zg-924 TaxID=2678505 RepID=UPI0021090440|nr:GTP pyrophosphokinase [Ruminococcus sp. zg-924]MCQ4022796.1 HD domain-containing protein [Ruminococcus sp. zg-924]
MLYTKLTKKALNISFSAHKNQVDKSGMPYVYHPFHLAEQMDDEYSTCVALLHDVVEDTDITIEDLKSEGFPSEVINAIELMTHDDSIPYLDYVKIIKTNPIASKVKLADLKHNSDLSRLDVVDNKAIERVEKYKKAINILTCAE